MDKGSSALTDALLGGATGLGMSSAGGGKGILPLLLGGAMGYGLSRMGQKHPLAQAAESIAAPQGPQGADVTEHLFPKGTPDAPWSDWHNAPFKAHTSMDAIAQEAGKLPPVRAMGLPQVPTGSLAEALKGAGGAGGAAGGLGALAGKAVPVIQGLEVIKGLRDKKKAEETPQYKTGFVS